MERNTIQKEIILSIIKKLDGHATANEIYEKVNEEFPTIGKSTICRNLDRFVDQGLIAKREIPNGPSVYDPIVTDHYHVKCTECNRVFDVDMEFIWDLESSIGDKRGFIISGHEITFSGICPDCRKKQEHR